MIAPRQIVRLLVAAVAAGCWAASAAGGQRYVDDFSQSAGAWRYGNAIPGRTADGMRLDAERPEATLPGTVVPPNNLKTFTASLRWSFGKAGTPTLSVGWGKPFEWDRFEDCAVSLLIDRGGRITVSAQQRTIGTGQLPAPKDEVYNLTFVQEPNRVVLRSDMTETSFPLPVGQECRPGYLTLRSPGGDAAAAASIRRIEIECSADQPPMTAAERHREIQVWAKLQLQESRALLGQFESHLRAERAAGRWGYPTDMAVSPGLIRLGEKIEVKLHASGRIPAVCKATVVPDYLSANPGAAETLKLNWRPDGNKAQSARVVLVPKRPGNWRVVWQIGNEELSRVIGVVDSGYAVCRFFVTTYPGMSLPGHAPYVLHQRGLAADFWDGSEWTSPFSRTVQDLTAHYRPYAEMRHRYGDRILPLCNANYMIAGCPDANLWKLDPDVQRGGLRLLMPLWDQLGLGPMEILGSYTFGHETPGIARQLGIKAIDSLVQWQNWRDGGDDNGWLINHWGAPTVPYFASATDFRMVARGKSIVALPQGTTSNIRAYTVMTLEGCPQLSGMRRHSDQMGETSNIDRFQTTADLWLAEAPCQRDPLFLSVNLENFVDSPDWDRANMLGVNYLCDQARHKKLVFASGADMADYLNRHYDKQPESWLYWPDIYCGYVDAFKPRCVADRIELSNADFHSVHQQGAALPQFFWDFARPRVEPLWDDQAKIRTAHGLCDPDLLTADNCVPRMTDLEGIRARVRIDPDAGGVQIHLEIESSKPLRVVPVGVWQIPLCKDGLKVVATSKHTRYIAVVDGSTENLNGIVVCRDIPPGKTGFNIRLQGTSRQPLDPTFHIGEHVHGRVFLRNGIPYAYAWLATANPQPGILKVQVPAGRKARVHYNDGHEEDSLDGTLTVRLDQAWQHASPLLSGLTAEGLASGATFTLTSGEVPKP